MAKARTVWRCQECGATALRWLGRCTECGTFGSLVEEMVEVRRPLVGAVATQGPVPLAASMSEPEQRVATGIPEFDLVLGGGLVAGSMVLLGGEPGVGKSTLLLQACDSLARAGRRVLYVCGEESPAQVAMRARRLGVAGDGLDALPEVDIAAVERVVRDSPPDVLVVDSIQTAFDPDMSSAPGSVGQVRACTARLMRIAKDLAVTTMVVGHVTKEGAIAGPRVLEHMVDVVLYFEGDRDHAFRIVRAVKNRFGSVSEIGVFEMRDNGLVGVGDPSSLFLGERTDPLPGSVVMPAMEGSRPLLVEIQALVTPSYLQIPRRLATGIENGRLLQVLAVIERRTGFGFGSHDVYVTVTGGAKVSEPAVDTPLAIALVSALRDVPVPLDLAAFGEVGLTGRVRSVSHSEARVREAVRQGLSRIVMAESSSGATVPGTDIHEAGSLGEVLEAVGLTLPR